MYFCSKENETERGSNALKREKKRVGRRTFAARRTKRNAAAMRSRGRKRGYVVALLIAKGTKYIECGSNAFKREKKRVGRLTFVARRTKRNAAAMRSRWRKEGRSSYF